MSTIDEQFVEFIVKSLVGDPDAIQIKRSIDEKGVLLELTVAPDDLGRVIGKRGATAQSIRTLLRALGTKNDARYNLKIVDPNGGPSSAPAQSHDQPAQTDEPKSEPVDEPVADQPLESELDELRGGEPVDTNSAEQPVEEERSVVDKTRKELEALDDLDI